MNWWLLKRRVHSSWLVAWLSFGFIFGIFVARYFSVNLFVLSVLILFLPFAFYKKYLVFIPLIFLAGLALGQFRGDQALQDIRSFDQYINKTVTVTGRVDNISDASSGLSSFCLDDLSIDNKKVAGRLFVTANDDDFKNGDYATVSGLFKTGFGKYTAVIYRADVIEYYKVQDSGRDAKDYFGSKIRELLPETESDLGLGFLLGEKNDLSSDFVTALQLAGLTHIVVASGYNLTILVRIARRLFVKVSKYLSLLTSLIMIFGFISITGLSPSMVRAGIVSVLSLLAWYYGRKFHPIVLLLFVAALTLIYDPNYLWSDIGWQLSFAAFAGVMIIAPLATRYFFEKPKIGFVPQLLIETISAQIATLPILIVYFGQISNVALIANILVLPLVPLAMLLVFITGLSSLIITFIAGVFAAPTNWLLGYMINVINLFANLPWAATSIKFDWVIGGCMYVGIIAACLYMRSKTKFNLREVNIVE